MTVTLRVALFGTALVAVVGCRRGDVPTPADPPPPARGVTAGVAHLLKQQSDDGAWRSDVYATFRDGTALTGLVLRALQDADEATEASPARAKGSAWLAKFATADGTVAEPDDGFPYPVYTAALAVVTLSHPSNTGHAKARDAWVRYLLERQLTEANGWSPDDKQYGGWGYYPRVPKKPGPGQAVPAQHLLESNLSATAFAVDALSAAGHNDLGAYQNALRFVHRCQNSDGGFHFIYDDPVRNKAGLVDPSATRSEFRSYGSATADGVRVWAVWEASYQRRHTNAAIDPPVAGTRSADWLGKHFAADRHPGDYLPAFEPTRNAVYFYYAASVARTLRMLGGHCEQLDQLAEALLARQKADGSWVNDRDQQRENDPLVATAHAVSALAACRPR